MHCLLVGAVSLTICLPQEPARETVADDWRAFRGTHGTATSESRVPIAWDDLENIAWELPLPGPGSSSPVVVGDRVFVTCWSGYAAGAESSPDVKNLRRHLLCIHRDTAEILWSAEVPPAATEDQFGGRMATHGYASSTPVSDGEHVYVFFGKAGVHAFDLDGKKLWQADVGGGSSEWKTGSGSSPALFRDLLFINASDESHSLRALSRKTGELVWERATPALDQAYGTPVLATGAGDPVLLLALLGEIWALAPSTGEPRWTLSTRTNGALAPTIVRDGDVFYSFGGQTTERSHAIRLGDVDGDSGERLLWSSREGTYVSTPLLTDGHLYWVDDGGVARCAKSETGELIYKERLGGSFYASPVRAGDAIYAVSRSSGTYVLPAEPRFEILAHNRLESDDTLFDGTPAVSRGQLFLRSGRSLYCIEE